MKRKFFSLLATLLVMFTVLGTQAFAARERIYLPANQVWVIRNATRSTRYSYASATNHAVYPVKGEDTFTRIQARLTNTSGTVISLASPVTLYEGAGSTNIYIREGYLNLTNIRFNFRGNSTAAAYTDVTYLGR